MLCLKILVETLCLKSYTSPAMIKAGLYDKRIVYAGLEATRREGALKNLSPPRTSQVRVSGEGGENVKRISDNAVQSDRAGLRRARHVPTQTYAPLVLACAHSSIANMRFMHASGSAYSRKQVGKLSLHNAVA